MGRDRPRGDGRSIDRAPLYRAFVAAIAALSFAACEAPVACEPGTEGCACEAASRCGDGLVCSGGTCAAPEEIVLGVPSDARACEVLLRDAGGQVTGARFGEGVTGAHVREAPRTSLSFASSGGALGTVRVQVLGDAGAFSIERSRCFDASGRALADGVRVGG